MDGTSCQRSSLVSLPPEIGAAIFSALSSFPDVFALAATCRALRAVWHDNAASIFGSLAPREIGFQTLARSLLASQGGAPVESGRLTAPDVLRMARNARKIDQSAARFGREVARRAGSYRYGGYHPPYLSPTEKARFARAYYRLWSLLELDDAKWKGRCEKLTMRQLARTSEMALLPSPFGEELGPDLDDLQNKEVRTYPIPPRRIKFHVETQNLYFERHLRLYGAGSDEVLPFSLYGCGKSIGFLGYADFSTLFDEFQKQFASNIFYSIKRPAEVSERQHRERLRDEVWGESSEDELYD